MKGGMLTGWSALRACLALTALGTCFSKPSRGFLRPLRLNRHAIGARKPLQFLKNTSEWAADCCTQPAKHCTGQVLSMDGATEGHRRCRAARGTCAALSECRGVYARGAECVAVICDERMDHGEHADCIYTPMLANRSFLPLFGAVSSFASWENMCGSNALCLFGKQRSWCDRHFARARAAGISPDQVVTVRAAPSLLAFAPKSPSAPLRLSHTPMCFPTPPTSPSLRSLPPPRASKAQVEFVGGVQDAKL